MSLREQTEYRAVSGLLCLCRRMPESWVYAVFHGLGLLGYLLLGRRRKTALMNTGVVFPEKSVRERKRIVRRHFSCMADSLALNSMIMSGRISNERLLGMVDAPGWERFSAVLDSAPAGVLVFSAHIGNWELMPLYAGIRLGGPKIHIIARQTTNRLLEERIVRPMRERFGVKIFYKKNAMLKIMQAARKGEPSGIMIDQKLNLQEGIAIDFFGRTAGTTPSPAILQLRLGITTIPFFMIHTGKRKYRLLVGEPVEWQDNGETMDEQVSKLTQHHQKLVEQVILQYPEQWFWVHDRWELWKKSRKK